MYFYIFWVKETYFKTLNQKLKPIMSWSHIKICLNISFSFICWLKVTLNYFIQSISLLIFVSGFRFFRFNFDCISIVFWGKILISIVFRFCLLWKFSFQLYFNFDNRNDFKPFHFDLNLAFEKRNFTTLNNEIVNRIMIHYYWISLKPYFA